MATQKCSSTTTLSATSNIITTSSTPKSVAVTMNNVQQQLHQLQRITQQMPIFMTSSKTTSSNITMTSLETKSIAATITKVHQQSQHQKQHPGLCYILYLHVVEVRRRKSPFMSIANTKLELTNELITKTMKNNQRLSPDEFDIISQETIYKTNLRREIANANHQQLMENYQKQQKRKFQPKQFLQQQQLHYQPSSCSGAAAMQGIENSSYFSRKLNK